jgi:hypothetical protein
MKARTQKELGRKEFVMNQIISDSKMSLEDELMELNEMPENFIDSIYEVSYDEMTSIERNESKEWISEQLNERLS